MIFFRLKLKKKKMPEKILGFEEVVLGVIKNLSLQKLPTHEEVEESPIILWFEEVVTGVVNVTVQLTKKLK